MTIPQIPQTLPVITSNIPGELKNGRRFVAWRQKRKASGDWTKPPINARTGQLASVDDPSTWVDFDTAHAYATAHSLPGIGIVLTGTGLTSIDLDHCFAESGDLTPETAATVERFNTYTERSPGGNGLRLFVRGQLPPGRRRREDAEAYDDGQYMTLTGHIYGEPRPIAERQAELNTWHAATFERQPQKGTPGRASGRQGAGSLTDEEILRRVNPESYAADPRYPSDSERDLAFTTYVAFYAGPGNAEQVERVWRASSLWREKDEREDYRQRTIEKAFNRDTFYQPQPPPTKTWKHATPPPVSGGSGEPVCLPAAELNALHARIATLEAENAELRALTSRTASIRRNTGLRGSKDTAAALAFDLAGQQPDEDGYYQVSYPKMAESAGVSDDTIARDLKRFAKAGLLDRETRRILHERPNPETGEIVKTIEPRVFVKPTGNMTPIELAERFAAIDVREFRKVEPRPCPVCKADAGTTIQHVETCNGCGAEVAKWQTERQPASDQTADREPQVAVYETIPSSVVVTKLPQLAVHATKALEDNTSTAEPDRKPHNAVHPPGGGLADLVRDTAPDRNAAAWFARESEHQRFLENSIAVGD
jgi:hypothetical protein